MKNVVKKFVLTLQKLVKQISDTINERQIQFMLIYRKFVKKIGESFVVYFFNTNLRAIDTDDAMYDFRQYERRWKRSCQSLLHHLRKLLVWEGLCAVIVSLLTVFPKFTVSSITNDIIFYTTAMIILPTCVYLVELVRFVRTKVIDHALDMWQRDTSTHFETISSVSKPSCKKSFVKDTDSSETRLYTFFVNVSH